MYTGIARASAFCGVFALSALLAACAHGPSVEEGRALYESNGCASCHGRDGHGDGPVAHTLDARPTDFRYPRMFLRGSSPDAVAKTLFEGVALHLTSSGPLTRSHHELVMPRFNHLSDEERHSLALYVLSIQKEIQP